MFWVKHGRVVVAYWEGCNALDLVFYFSSGGVDTSQVKLEQRHVSIKRVLEKDDAISELLSAGGSTAETCVVCFGDYARGDLLRRLRCGHAFHCECVDRWCVCAEHAGACIHTQSATTFLKPVSAAQAAESKRWRPLLPCVQTSRLLIDHLVRFSWN